MNPCYISIGSNLQQPVEQIMQALYILARQSELHLMQASSLYASPPLGWVQQPDFVNAVVLFETRWSALEVLDFCQSVESKMGRVRQGGVHRWGPRIIDLDILLYADHVIRNERLTVPHPGLTKRDFVLFPLFEIASKLMLPDGSSLITHCGACKNQLTLLKPRAQVMESIREHCQMIEA